MSDTQNPWVSPASDLETAPESGATVDNGVITAAMQRYLGEASPWLRFLGVMSFIGVGSLVLFSLVMLVVGLFSISGSGIDAGVSIILGVVYLGVSVVMFFPARFTWGFGTRIRAWKQSGNIQDLEEAFRNNKSLWKFSGIVMIVYLAMVPVFMVIAIGAGVLTSFM